MAVSGRSGEDDAHFRRREALRPGMEEAAELLLGGEKLHFGE